MLESIVQHFNNGNTIHVHFVGFLTIGMAFPRIPAWNDPWCHISIVLLSFISPIIFTFSFQLLCRSSVGVTLKWALNGGGYEKFVILDYCNNKKQM